MQMMLFYSNKLNKSSRQIVIFTEILKSAPFQQITLIYCFCYFLSVLIPNCFGKKTTTIKQANWYKASQYCRFHGLHLASISSQEENDRLEKHIRDFGNLNNFNKTKTNKQSFDIND